jgi:hypothetical protein
MTQGSIVKWQEGYYRITSIRGNKANLGSVFGNTIYHKGIAVSELVEASKEWYARWTQSETYQCM